MAPLLLDRRNVITVCFIFVLAILVSLAGGYVLGYQCALNKSSHSSFVSQLFIPAASPVINELTNTSNEPGEDMDVDAPDTVDSQKAKAVEKDSMVEDTKTLEENISGKDKAKNAEQTEKSVAIKTKVFDNATLDEAEYSIQVGLYGIKVNAERKVKALINEELSGYLTDFVNGKGDKLFNVRFGYFLDKESVIEALKIYQKNYTGDGYIVRVRRKTKS